MIKEKSELNNLLKQKFVGDHLITLATSNNNIPSARHVNVVYDNLNFYFITEASSKKIDEIKNNPIVALCGDWFISKADANILGPLNLSENKKIFNLLNENLGPWFNKSKINFEDENIIIVSLNLKSGNFKLNNIYYEFDIN